MSRIKIKKGRGYIGDQKIKYPAGFRLVYFFAVVAELALYVAIAAGLYNII